MMIAKLRMSVTQKLDKELAKEMRSSEPSMDSKLVKQFTKKPKAMAADDLLQKLNDENNRLDLKDDGNTDNLEII